MSYRAVGHEFNVCESIRWYVQKKEEKICQCVCEATLEIANVASTVCDELMEKRPTLWIHEMNTN